MDLQWDKNDNTTLNLKIARKEIQSML